MSGPRHHDHTLADALDQRHVVLDEQHRHALGHEREQMVADFLRERGVHAGRRLVEQYHARLGHQGSPNLQKLLLPPGESRHLMVYGAQQPGEGIGTALAGSASARQREAELAEKALSIAARLRLSHVIDNKVTALSGGQKKLLEIGRALMAEPRLVLFDEPTAGVNPTLQNEIGEQLLELVSEGMTVLLIEHDMGLSPASAIR